MDKVKIVDPNYFGPGVWKALHIISARAKTMSQKKSAIWSIKVLAEGIKCNNCRTHFLAFIEKNPIESYFNAKDNRGRIVGIFKFTYDAHCAVQLFQGKPIPTLEEAYDFWSDPEVGVCFDDCDSSNRSDMDSISQPSGNNISTINPVTPRPLYVTNGSNQPLLVPLSDEGIRSGNNRDHDNNGLLNRQDLVSISGKKVKTKSRIKLIPK